MVEIPFVDRLGPKSKITAWIRLVPLSENSKYILREVQQCVFSGWTAYENENLGSRKELVGQESDLKMGRRKLEKSFAECQGTVQQFTIGKMQLRTAEEIKVQPQGSTCGWCISRTHSCADSTHTLAIRQPRLWTLAGPVLWTDEIQSYSRCWGIFCTSGIIFFLISDLFWSK